LRCLRGTGVLSVKCGGKKAQQEIALTADLPRAAIREMEDHSAGSQPGFQRLQTFLKVHRFTPYPL